MTAAMALLAAVVVGAGPGGTSGSTGPSGATVSQADAGRRLERIRAAGVLRVCIWPDYYSITFRNPKSGELSGIDIDLSRAFAADLGVRVEYVDSSFPAFIADLLGDRCDVAMFGVGMLPDRAAKVSFSAPYLRSDIYAVTTRIHPTVRTWADIDQPGRVVAVQAGTFMEAAMKGKLQHAQMVSIRPPATREREVQSGRADVFLTDYPYSRRLVDNADWARILAPTSPVFPLSYAYAVAPGDAAWLARVDRFVSDVKRDGRLRAAAHAAHLEEILLAQ